jgi:hypothetical protein
MAAEVTAFSAGFAQADGQERWPIVAAVAGATLLVAVAAGALVAPSAPAPFSHRLRVHEYFVANHDAALNQSLLVHGVAGVALLVLVVALWRAFAPGLARTLFISSGVAAAAASFAQLDIVFRIESHIEGGVGVRQTDALFDALNRACALKLGLLALALVAALSLVTHSSRALRWLPAAGYALAAVLAISALALVTSVPSAHLLLTFVRP